MFAPSKHEREIVRALNKSRFDEYVKVKQYRDKEGQAINFEKSDITENSVVNFNNVDFPDFPILFTNFEFDHIVSFKNCNFVGQLNCDGAHFKKSLRFISSRFDKRLILDNIKCDNRLIFGTANQKRKS